MTPDKEKKSPNGDSVPSIGNETEVTPDDDTQEYNDTTVLSEEPDSEDTAEQEFDFSDAFLRTADDTEITNTEGDNENVELSSHGLGNYPEVPPNFPFSVVWEATEEQRARIPSELFEELELLGLVMIRKWNEGDHDFVGAFMANGKVYPTYPDVAYVKWGNAEEPGEWRISEVSTVDSSISEQLLNGVIPPGIEIVDQDSSGIEPYEFLSQ